jgi:hypothetical protein
MDKIILFLVDIYDPYHGKHCPLEDVKEELDKLIPELNDDNRYEPAYFTIYEYLESNHYYSELFSIFNWIIKNCNNLNKKNNDGDTILHLIAKSLSRTGKSDKHELVVMLMENGCDKTIKNSENKTAAEVAKDNYKNFDEKKHWEFYSEDDDY